MLVDADHAPRCGAALYPARQHVGAGRQADRAFVDQRIAPGASDHAPDGHRISDRAARTVQPHQPFLGAGLVEPGQKPVGIARSDLAGDGDGVFGLREFEPFGHGPHRGPTRGTGSQIRPIGAGAWPLRGRSEKLGRRGAGYAPHIGHDDGGAQQNLRQQHRPDRPLRA